MPRYYFDMYIERFSKVDRIGLEMTRDEVEPTALSILADGVRGALPGYRPKICASTFATKLTMQSLPPPWF